MAVVNALVVCIFHSVVAYFGGSFHYIYIYIWCDKLSLQVDCTILEFMSVASMGRCVDPLMRSKMTIIVSFDLMI